MYLWSFHISNEMCYLELELQGFISFIQFGFWYSDSLIDLEFLYDVQTASIMWGFLRNHISEIDKLQISWKYKLHLPCTIFATTYLYTKWFISLLVIRTLQYRYIAQNLYNGIPPQLQIINTLYIYLRIPSIIQSRCSRWGTHKFK